jgi:hypothetical protein
MPHKLRLPELLVVIPHASVSFPREIPRSILVKDYKKFLIGEESETDRGTASIYNLKKTLDNNVLSFPVSQVFINVCRNPNNLDEACPLFIRDAPIYRKGMEPNIHLRRALVERYSLPFYKSIQNTKKGLILNGHSTIAGHSSLGNEKLQDDIVLSSFLIAEGEKIQFCPDYIIAKYKDELKKRLPDLKIGVNSVYLDSYDQMCVMFGGNFNGMNSVRVPIIHQETDENLYINKNGKVIKENVEKLRKAFAESLYYTMRSLKLG